MSNPYDRALDELRAAYFAVPVGHVTEGDLFDAMPRVMDAARTVLEVTGRICPVCSEYHVTDTDAAHSDIAAILRALDLGDHARPVSTHVVVREEVLPAIRRLREATDAD